MAFKTMNTPTPIAGPAKVANNSITNDFATITRPRTYTTAYGTGSLCPQPTNPPKSRNAQHFLDLEGIVHRLSTRGTTISQNSHFPASQ